MRYSDESPRFEEMNKVVMLHVQNVNPTEIARRLNIKRVDVLNHLDDWRASAVGSDVMRERVEELIAATDEHYSSLIRAAYEIVAEVDADMSDGTIAQRAQMLNQKKGAIDLIAKLEKDRIDMLHKSGLLENDLVGEQLAEMEKQMEHLEIVLDDELCEPCRIAVMGRLARENNSTVVVPGSV